MSVPANLQELAERWSDADPGERSNFQLYLTELTEALGVSRPRPKGGGYEFEFPVRVVEPDGTETTKPADLYKEGCFVLEAKDLEEGRSNEALVRRAYGQVRGYVTHLPGDPPPYLLVLDVGRLLIVWDRWTGTYGGFNAGRRIDLTRLHEREEDIRFLQDVWERPEELDPRARAGAVTQEIAVRLAQLAASLEARGHDQEDVARFLIRCVFTMFAEDVGLLEGEPFLTAVQDIGMQDPAEFTQAITELWSAMDTGERFGLRKLREFDGHFFHDRTVLPLTREDLGVLLEAARADWTHVEPSIFGTLFTRALDPEERHRLGAEFTPPEYVERLVRPTIEEPVRERWKAVETAVFQLRESGRAKDQKAAEKQLREFHGWLRGLRVLDPACGSGNFLYMSLAALKRIEAEVLQTLEDLTGNPDLVLEEVGPWQFHGLEIKPWAREIAELTLWIGYFQFWMAHHGHTRPPEPVLRDTGTMEVRDAVLAWDEVEVDPERAVPDPTPKVRDPVTGELIPDPDGTLPYHDYKNPQPAPWPEADFIVGNPPYMGRGRQRAEFGHGYVDALRAAYPEVNENSDYVMYWWYRAAHAVAEGRTIRAGLITTNTITQRHNREAVTHADEEGVRVVWAVSDHPWVDETGAADVRVAMTVTEKEPSSATLVEVNDAGEVMRRVKVETLNADLTASVDVVGAAEVPLRANKGLSSQGFTLVGQGFVLDVGEARKLHGQDAPDKHVLRPYLSGRDITKRPRDQYVIDFGLMSQQEAREHPVLYDIVRSRVKPTRDNNNRKAYRENWWRYAEPRPGFRDASTGLDRYIATSETSKHRFFIFLPAEAACSHAVVVLALDDAFHLGVLSSWIHVTWTLASGGRLGVGNDPRYQKSLCFDSFPFPEAEESLRARIRQRAEELDRLRKKALDRDESLTMTGIYNVVRKLEQGEDLTESDRETHTSAACGVLCDLHKEIDRLVAQAYGWEWPLAEVEILDRLITLHDERRAEEEAGQVRWLRPAYQAPRFGEEVTKEPELELGETAAQEGRAPLEWPESAVAQIGAIKGTLSESPGAVEGIVQRFSGGNERLIRRHLETLELLGEVLRGTDGRYRVAVEPAVI